MGRGLLAEGNEVSSLGCSEGLEAAGSQFEAALKTRRRNRVEPEKCVLGKRDTLSFTLYKQFMKCLMSICLLQRRAKVCKPVLKIA